jgi:PadR family transcriptional regulator PadR
MPRGKSGLTPAECAILDLIYQRPAHGYQIAQEMAREGGLSLIGPPERGKVYPLLGNLERRGLIKGEQRPDDADPTKTLFKTTAVGRRAFDRLVIQAKLAAAQGTPD